MNLQTPLLPVAQKVGTAAPALFVQAVSVSEGILSDEQQLSSHWAAQALHSQPTECLQLEQMGVVTLHVDLGAHCYVIL